jgi:hypothetical protein
MPAATTFALSMETAFLQLSAWIILYITEIGLKTTSILEALFPDWNALHCASYRLQLSTFSGCLNTNRL